MYVCIYITFIKIVDILIIFVLTKKLDWLLGSKL